MIAHPALGTLTQEGEDSWQGSLERDGLTLEVVLAGDQDGPFPQQVARLRNVVDNFAACRQRVVDFLASELASVPETKPSDFYVTGLWFLWSDRPEYFIVQLALRGDEYGLWKLEFDGERPLFLSRDD